MKRVLVATFLVLSPSLALYGVRVCCELVWGFRLSFNDTPSVPVGWYAVYPFTPQRAVRGAYACLPTTSPLAPVVLRESVESRLVTWGDTWLLKRIAAGAGDRVEEANELVEINGRILPNSRVHRADGLGQPLPRAPYPFALQAGQVWLASEHDKGFDSRYFGPVSVSALSCIGEPLWTF